jgi:hypothetical protein
MLIKMIPKIIRLTSLLYPIKKYEDDENNKRNLATGTIEKRKLQKIYHVSVNV